jgi:transposase
MAPHLPGKPGDPGRSGADNRLFVEAVLWLARTGSPWRDLPEIFGNWNSVFVRFSRWSKDGVWDRLFAAMADDIAVMLSAFVLYLGDLERRKAEAIFDAFSVANEANVLARDVQKTVTQVMAIMVADDPPGARERSVEKHAASTNARGSPPRADSRAASGPATVRSETDATVMRKGFCEAVDWTGNLWRRQEIRMVHADFALHPTVRQLAMAASALSGRSVSGARRPA